MKSKAEELKNSKNDKTKTDLKLRMLEPSDINDLLKWRNHPDVRKNFFNPNPLSYSEHEEWFKAKSIDPNCMIYIACRGENKIGSIRFEEEGIVKVSVMLNPDFLGKNFGSKIIRLGVEKFIGEKRPNNPIIAEIRKDNIASIMAFQKAGFKEYYSTFIFDSSKYMTKPKQ